MRSFGGGPGWHRPPSAEYADSGTRACWGRIVGATGATVFVLGSLMAMLGAAGLLLGWGWDEQAAASSAVVTGIVMLLVIAGDAGRPQLRRG